MKPTNTCLRFAPILVPFLFISCSVSDSTPSKASIEAMKLKRGELIACGPADKQFGELQFQISDKATAEDFNLGVKLLHSFEYDESEKVFSSIIDKQPSCAMAYWGVAMSNFHPLWSPPSTAELQKGAKAVEIARSIANKTERESAYIEAIGSFYKDWQQTSHRSRCLAFEKSMEELYARYPDDREAGIFYALALTAAADPADKTFTRQKKAGSILNALYAGQPNHPGILHYLIHTYDSPQLAELGLEAARKYASVASSSAHALHMPSHIFTRLGLWEESISSNLASVNAAQCYASAAGIKGHWDEEIHGIDYLVYAYLQKGDNADAKKYRDYILAISEVEPINFKVTYAFASVPSRYLLENKLWEEASALQLPGKFPWQEYPWQKAIVHFTRLMGAVHTAKTEAARQELQQLTDIYNSLKEKDEYKAGQVKIQMTAGEAWIHLASGNQAKALQMMKEAADMEDRTEKHPVTPGEVLPARELLADMLMALDKTEEAAASYTAVLKKQPNRFNALYGAAKSHEMKGDLAGAAGYYRQLGQVAGQDNEQRTELRTANAFLKKNGGALASFK